MKETEQWQKNLRHLAKGGKLVDTGGYSLILDTVGILYDDGTGEDFSLQALDDMTIYIDPKDTRISELEATVARLIADLVSMNTPKPTYKHLSAEEVRDIEVLFESGTEVTTSLIVSTYSTSFSVISRIHNGEHSKTSSQYKTYLIGKLLSKLPTT